jgi:hypothetical protein
MAGVLKAKHMNWNSRLITCRGSLLRDYNNRNSCLTYWSGFQTTAHYKQYYPRRPWYSCYQRLHLTGASDCLFCTQLGSPAYPHRQLWSIIISGIIRLPALHASEVGYIPGLLLKQISGKPACRRRGGNRQVCRGADQLHPKGHNGFCSKTSIRADPQPPLPASIQEEIRLKNRLRRQWEVTRNPVLKACSIVSRGRWPIGWTTRAMNTGALHYSPWTVTSSHYERWKRWWCELRHLRPACKWRKD